LAPGEAELKSRKKAFDFTVGAQARATRTAWLAVTAETMKSARAARSAWEAVKATPCSRACSRSAPPLLPPSLMS
jgi:hypothetical protein